MNLVQEYYTLATEVVLYKELVCDCLTAEKHNSRVERMCAIVVEIEQDYPEYKNDFVGLLSDKNPEIRLWVAHHILEYMCCDRHYRKCALREIRRRAHYDHTAYGYGERMWLKNWYKCHPKDRWI